MFELLVTEFFRMGLLTKVQFIFYSLFRCSGIDMVGLLFYHDPML